MLTLRLPFGFKQVSVVMKPILTIVLLVFYFSKVKSQSLSLKQEAVIRKTIQEHFGEYESSKINLQEYANCVEICGKDTLFNPNGYFYVFKLTGDTCIRLDKSVFHGFNFGRLLFSHQNELYALGGYGGFTCNNFLLKFDFFNKDWKKVSVNGSMPTCILGIAYKYNNEILSIGNFLPGNGIEKPKIDSSIYKLNLITMVWEKTINYLYVDLTLHDVYKTKDYTFLIGEINSYLFDKKNKYVEINNLDYKIKKESLLISQKLNQIKVITPKNLNEISIISLDSIYNSINAKKELIKNENIVSVSALYYVIGGALFLLSIFLYKNFFLKKKKLSEDQVNLFILNRLRADTNKNYSVDEIDVVFNIQHLSFDSKKLKRHRIIKELNEIYPNLITRIRSEEDKRQFIYKINKK